MFPISCNAIGDIIALVQLTRDVISALNDAKGSSQDFRNLEEELQAAADTLNDVVEVVSRSEDESFRSGVYVQVQRSGNIIRDMSLRLIKFEPLRDSLPNDWKQDVWGHLRRGELKIRWRFARQAEARDCRTKLAQCRGQLQLALDVCVWQVSSISLY
jgi:hypothetical protein